MTADSHTIFTRKIHLPLLENTKSTLGARCGTLCEHFRTGTGAKNRTKFGSSHEEAENHAKSHTEAYTPGKKRPPIERVVG